MKEMNAFNEITHRPLRIYNRCVFTSNLLEDAGRAAVEDYLDQFTTTERVEMAQMYNLVKKLGVKKVRALVTEGLEFSNDDYVAVVND